MDQADGPRASATAVKPVSSLIATLPTAAGLHRTIDQYYNQAHSSPPVQNANDLVRLTAKRLPYFMVFVALGLANVGDAAEIGSMGFLLANPSFLEEVVQGYDGIVASALYIGMLFGGLIAGPLCDASGRRNVLLYGLLLNSSFGVGAAVATAPWQLVLCRIFMGVGIGGVVASLLALTSEHAPSRLRGSYLNFVSAFWTVGSIYVALIALLFFGTFDKSWRLFVLINAAPSLAAFALVICFVPESASLLALRGKHSHATKAANRLATAMGYNGDPLREDEIRAHFSAPLSKSTLSTWSLYKTSETRRNILFSQALWFTVSFGSGMCLWMARVFYELSFVQHVYTMTLFFALASIPGVFLGGYFMDKVGRTVLLTASLLSTTVCLAIFAILTLFTNQAWPVVLAACVFHSSLVVAWSALSVITAEIFPTSIRSTAMGLCVASGRTASIIVHLVSAPLVEHEQPAILMFLGTASFALGIIVSFLSRLQNKTGAPLHDTEEQQQKSNM